MTICLTFPKNMRQNQAILATVQWVNTKQVTSEVFQYHAHEATEKGKHQHSNLKGEGKTLSDVYLIIELNTALL